MTLTRDELVALEQDSVALVRSRGGPKVFQRADGCIYKVFPGDHRWGPMTYGRKAERFARNAHRLGARGIVCPEVVDVLDVEGGAWQVVVYRPIPGVTLREGLADPSRAPRLREQLVRRLAQTHDLGMLFAGGHLGNYITGPDETLGLIDVHDLWLLPLGLPVLMRAAAFRILLKYEGDRQLLSTDGRLGPFLDAYLEASGIGFVRRYLFFGMLRWYVPEAAAAI